MFFYIIMPVKMSVFTAKNAYSAPYFMTLDGDFPAMCRLRCKHVMELKKFNILGKETMKK